MKAVGGAVLALAAVAAIGSNIDPNPDHPWVWAAVLIGAMVFGAAAAAVGT